MSDFYATDTFTELQHLRKFADDLQEPERKQLYLTTLEKAERAAERELDEQRHEARALEREGQERQAAICAMAKRAIERALQVKDLQARIKELEDQLNNLVKGT
jgi:hypothetical protein